MTNPIHETAPSIAAVDSLETPRLIMRRHGLSDFEDSYAMWSDPEVCRFISGKPSTREEVWARILRYAGHWALMDFGYWAVREKGSDRFVGDVGFADFKRDIDPPLEGTPEIGWALAPSMQGKGYATEAVQAALRWADKRWPGIETVCIIDPQNAASLRIAAKCGYTESTHAIFKGQETLVFRRSAAGG